MRIRAEVPVLKLLLFLWDSSLRGFPGCLVLLALGWTTEWVDEHYRSALIGREGP